MELYYDFFVKLKQENFNKDYKTTIKRSIWVQLTAFRSVRTVHGVCPRPAQQQHANNHFRVLRSSQPQNKVHQAHSQTWFNLRVEVSQNDRQALTSHNITYSERDIPTVQNLLWHMLTSYHEVGRTNQQQIKWNLGSWKNESTTNQMKLSNFKRKTAITQLTKR